MSAEADILCKYKTIAVVGLSNNDALPAYSVAKYMQDAGYRIIPVNPNETQVLGEKAYSDIVSIPEQVEIVDIFRRPEYVGAVVADAIAAGAKAVWMQQGIINKEAAANARAAGLEVVMDECIRTWHRRLQATLQ
ncbi:MAG: CoA-binding protein [Dehalococcoidia bacterium]